MSAKRVIPTKRRVQAFVLVAIAIFVAGGTVANRYVTGSHVTPPSPPPVTDAVVAPRPEGSARPATSSPPAPDLSKSLAQRPKPHRPSPSKTVAARPPTATSTKGMSTEALAVKLTNDQRAQHGCSALRVDSRLRTAARAHSADMRDKHYFDHNSPDGRTPWDRIKAAGYADPGAENIAQGYPTAQAVVQGWMNSSGHRANILNCDLKAIGIGVATGQGGPWWTQDFGFK